MRQHTFFGYALAATIAGMTIVLPHQSAARPTISDISGEVRHGGSITVFGSDFGTGDILPISFDDFESGSDGQDLGAPLIGPRWSFLSMTPNPHYSSDRAVSGNLSARIHWVQYGISAFGWCSGTPYPSLYLSFYRYMDPKNDTVVPENFKPLYIFGSASYNGASDQPQFMLGAIMRTRPNWQYATQSYPTINYPWERTTSYFDTNNRWQRWEIYVQLDSPYTASNGIIQGFLDGKLVFEEEGLNLTDVDGQWECVRLGNLFRGFTPEDYCYYDDIYISSSRARLELGNNPVFSECTVREVQVPTAWTNDRISADVRTLHFVTGQTAYLFAIGPNGLPCEEPLRVTIGGDARDDADAPQLSVLIPAGNGEFYDSPTPVASVSGTASDNIGVTGIVWENSLGDAGTCSGTTSWRADIPLMLGQNVVTFTVYDAAGNTGTAQVTLQYITPGEPLQPLASD